MKKYLVQVGMVLSIGIGSMSATLAQSQSAKSVKVFIKGMVCSFCAQGLIGAFKRVEGVSTVQASLDEGSITLQFVGSTGITDDQIAKIVKDSGYEVKKIETVQD
jgi:copper chaperone